MKKLVMYFVFLLAFVSIASAQYYYSDSWSFGGYGVGDIIDIYSSYAYWFDFFISLIIFISLGKIVFGGEAYRRGSKGLTIGMSLALSFALVLWESRSGFNLGDIWFIALLALILSVGVAIYRSLRGRGFNLKTGAIVFFILGLTYLILSVIYPSFWDYFSFLPSTIRTIFVVLLFCSALYVLYLIFKVTGERVDILTTNYPRIPSSRPIPRPVFSGGGREALEGIEGGAVSKISQVDKNYKTKVRMLESEKQEIIGKYEKLIQKVNESKDPSMTYEIKLKLKDKLRARRDRELGEINEQEYLERLRLNKYTKNIKEEEQTKLKQELIKEQKEEKQQQINIINHAKEAEKETNAKINEIFIEIQKIEDLPQGKQILALQEGKVDRVLKKLKEALENASISRVNWEKIRSGWPYVGPEYEKRYKAAVEREKMLKDRIYKIKEKYQIIEQEAQQQIEQKERLQLASGKYFKILKDYEKTLEKLKREWNSKNQEVNVLERHIAQYPDGSSGRKKYWIERERALEELDFIYKKMIQFSNKIKEYTKKYNLYR